ncbi:MAG TPA: M48 family metalloprotease [Albitalea sp.]|nr:M48 family metalloprotease [Albitalea sp.]
MFAALDRMRLRMKGPRFHHVLVTFEFNAAVVQRPLFGLIGPSRNYLILGLPLLESLSPDEALAVVAHEYGHLSGAHGRFAAFIYRLRLSWTTVHAVSHRWKGAAGKALRRLVEWYAPYFNGYTFVLARANEYQADAAAAELAGGEVTATALKRVDVNSAHFSGFLQDSFRHSLHSPMPTEDIASRWAAAANRFTAEDGQRWLGRALALPANVSDTHPPLSARLGALQVAQASPADQLPGAFEGPSAACAWLGASLDSVRQRIGSTWRDEVAKGWKERHDAAQQQRRRLAELRATAEPTPDEHAERLRLCLACEDDAGFSDDLAAFVSAHPDNALGPYLEGVWRLSKGDEGGLESVERAMALDADATKPACERAFEFLQGRDDARAKDYQERWMARDRWEQTVMPQLQQIDLRHQLRDPDLPSEQMQAVLALVQAHAAGVARAYLARRVLPAAPEVPTYVLALELDDAPPRLETGPQIVERVAGTVGWPVHLIVCTLEGKYAPMGRRLKALQGALIPLGH